MRLGLGLGLGVGRRRAWSPAALGNLASEWAADVGVTVVAGPKVSAWADPIGGRNATQSNDGLRPGYQADHGDGAPALVFSTDTGRRLAHTPIPGIPGGDFTAIWLMKKTSGAGAAWCQSRAGSNFASMWVGQLAGNQGYLAVYSDDQSTNVERNTANTATGWTIVTARRSGDVFGIRLDEGTEVTVSDPGGACTIDQAFIGLFMFGAVPQSPLDGFVRHGLIFTAYKSDANQVLVRQYLRDKWPGI